MLNTASLTLHLPERPPLVKTYRKESHSMNMNKSVKLGLVVLLAAFTVSACGQGKLKQIRQKRANEIGRQYESDKRETIFGEGGLFSGSGKDQANVGGGTGGIGVNSYLWRATLDTISFLPVTSADPFGGVILTDWYAPAETPNERFKMNVYILGRALRADGIQVAVFRQALDANGTWRDSPVEADAGRKIEDAILTRARQLRNETRAQQN